MYQREGLVDMWDEACRTGMSHTAYGILVDLFMLWDALDDDPQALITSTQKAAFREDLMQVLGDDDGVGLRYWRHLWTSDRDEFQRRALEHINSTIEGA